MQRRALRPRLLVTLLLPLLSMAVMAQSTRPASRTSPGYKPPPAVRPATITPARPIVVTPARPAVVTPARPIVVTPARPAVTTPARPAIITPARPAVITPGVPVEPYPGGYPVYPAYPAYPGGVVVPGGYPGVVMPAYPGGYIGPEVIRVTTSPAVPEADAPVPVGAIPAPAVVDQDAVDPEAKVARLVAVLGSIQRVQAAGASNTAASGDGEHLCVGFGTQTAYLDVASGQRAEPVTRGGYLGSRWDGDAWRTTAGAWHRGPVLPLPLLTINEVSPSRWPFEVGQPGARVTSIRLALVLVNDEDAEGRAPTGEAGAQDRYATMRAALASGQPALLPPAGEGSAGQGFAATLAAGLAEVMGGRTGSNAIGAMEWTLSLEDLRQILLVCPRYQAVPPQGELGRLRATGAPPAWVRTFTFAAPEAAIGVPGVTYQGEVWFLVVPNAALAAWQAPAGAMLQSR